jgi:two-component system sensor histidine kinase VicK
MAKELKATLNSMVTEKNKSEAILQNTSHGVLAYDVAGVLIHANTASIELLPGVDNPDMLVRQTLTLLGFEPEEIYHLSPEETRETTYENSQLVISASVTPYSSQQGRLDGFIIVLQDITRQAKLENMRKEFVANVSHELRTPLTSIRTYTETLLEGAHEDQIFGSNRR